VPHPAPHFEQFPSDSVLTYAAKLTLGANIVEENWILFEALLLKAALAEPTMLSVLGEIYTKFSSYHTDSVALTTLIHSVCAYHAPLQQGNEVSWALWLAKEMNIPISKQVADRVVKLDDDVVALAALDLNENGLFDAGGFAKWRSHMQAAELYERHWLIAYEAYEHGWLPVGRDGRNIRCKTKIQRVKHLGGVFLFFALGAVQPLDAAWTHDLSDFPPHVELSSTVRIMVRSGLVERRCW
jgi:hypothetical protein